MQAAMKEYGKGMGMEQTHVLASIKEKRAEVGKEVSSFNVALMVPWEAKMLHHKKGEVMFDPISEPTFIVSKVNETFELSLGGTQVTSPITVAETFLYPVNIKETKLRDIKNLLTSVGL